MDAKKTSLLFLLLLTPALGLCANDEPPPYRCACCSAYFGKSPNPPSFFGKGLGYQRLMKNSQYEEIVQRFDESYRKGEYTLQDLGWVGQALYALAAMKSDRPDPLKPVSLFREKKPDDMISHDVWWMQEKYRKKIWDKAAMEQYGNAALCAAGEFRAAYPRGNWFFRRYLTILIASGRYNDAIKEVKALRKDSLDLDTPLGEYLAWFMEQYLGSALYDQGATYLSTVRKTHGLDKEIREYWVKMLLRAVELESMPADKKNRLREKIRAI